MEPTQITNADSWRAPKSKMEQFKGSTVAIIAVVVALAVLAAIGIAMLVNKNDDSPNITAEQWDTYAKQEYRTNACLLYTSDAADE